MRWVLPLAPFYWWWNWSIWEIQGMTALTWVSQLSAPFYCYCLVAKLCPALCDPMNCSPPGSMGCPRQECQSGLPFPSPGDLPNPEIKPASSALAGRLFITEPPGKSTSSCKVDQMLHSPKCLSYQPVPGSPRPSGLVCWPWCWPLPAWTTHSLTFGHGFRIWALD